MRGFPAALVSVPGNIVQGLGSIVLALPVIYAFRSLADRFAGWFH